MQRVRHHGAGRGFDSFILFSDSCLKTCELPSCLATGSLDVLETKIMLWSQTLGPPFVIHSTIENDL